MPTCARCGQDNPDLSKFLQRLRRALAEPGRAGEERRIVSVLFVDLVGFTARSESLDPEDARAFLTPYYEEVRSRLQSFGGRVEKFIGDAVMGSSARPRPTGTTPSEPSEPPSPFETGPKKTACRFGSRSTPERRSSSSKRGPTTARPLWPAMS